MKQKPFYPQKSELPLLLEGMEYQAWTGYEWIDVTYPKTGFSKDQIEDAFKSGIARVKRIEKP